MRSMAVVFIAPIVLFGGLGTGVWIASRDEGPRGPSQKCYTKDIRDTPEALRWYAYVEPNDYAALRAQGHKLFCVKRHPKGWGYEQEFYNGDPAVNSIHHFRWDSTVQTWWE